MTTGYREMWAEPGIDLERRHRLLNSLDPVYNQICLSREDRPRGMETSNFEAAERFEPLPAAPTGDVR